MVTFPVAAAALVVFVPAMIFVFAASLVAFVFAAAAMAFVFGAAAVAIGKDGLHTGFPNHPRRKATGRWGVMMALVMLFGRRGTALALLLLIVVGLGG
jgi:hypothetical protein